jgi:hypothetical protein
MNTLQPMMCFEILFKLLHEKVEITYKKRFFTFSLATYEDEWILSSVETIFIPW